MAMLRFGNIVKHEKKIILVFVAAIALVALSYVAAEARERLDQGVKLSNGKKVYLGQSRADLTKKLQGSIRQVNGDFVYSGTDSKQIEAAIFMHQNRVESIDVIAVERNIHRSTGGRIGSSLSELKQRHNNKSEHVNKDNRRGAVAGIRIVGHDSVGYFLTNKCKPSDQVTSWVLSRKGREAVPLARVTGESCEK
jgi:hypothetical protein